MKCGGFFGLFMIFVVGPTLGMRFNEEFGLRGLGGGPCKAFLKTFLQTYCSQAEGNYGLCRECMPATCLQYVTDPRDDEPFNQCIAEHNRCCTRPGLNVGNVLKAAVCYGSGWIDAVGLGQLSVIATALGAQSSDDRYSFTGYDKGDRYRREEPAGTNASTTPPPIDASGPPPTNKVEGSGGNMTSKPALPGINFREEAGRAFPPGELDDVDESGGNTTGVQQGRGYNNNYDDYNDGNGNGGGGGGGSGGYNSGNGGGGGGGGYNSGNGGGGGGGGGYNSGNGNGGGGGGYKSGGGGYNSGGGNGGGGHNSGGGNGGGGHNSGGGNGGGGYNSGSRNGGGGHNNNNNNYGHRQNNRQQLTCRQFIKLFLRGHCGQAEGNYKLCGQCMGVTCLQYLMRAADPRPFKECMDGHNRCCTRPGAGLGLQSVASATACYASGWVSEVGEGQVSVVRTALGGQSQDAPNSFTGFGKREAKYP